MKNGKYQAKDIPDEIVLAAIRLSTGKAWATFWDVHALIPHVPAKVLRAKCASLIRRKVIDGCDGMHNCRGDYYIL